MAVVIGYAVGNRGLLAGRADRIPFIGVLATTRRVTCRIGLATLVRTAHDVAARINALLRAVLLDETEVILRAVGIVGAARLSDGSVRLTALSEVARISVVAVDAETR